MSQGRPRKPTPLKLVTGTERPSRVNHAEPDLPAARPRIPSDLSEGARAAWGLFTPRLERMGVLTDADGPALRRLCEVWAEVQTLQRIIGDNPSYQAPMTNRAGEPVMNHGEPILGPVKMRPEVAALADADRRLKTWMGEFGMTPAARGKVKVVDPAAAADPAAKYFG